VHYAAWQRHGDPLGCDPEWGRAQRFFQDVVLTHSSDECLQWPFKRDKNGYGIVWHKGKNRRAHRLACEHANGPPPSDEHQAAHTCGKGREGCVNPHHLYWALPVENTNDRIGHGTWGRKLTEQDVIEIHKLYGQLTDEQLAERFSVSPATIWNVLCKKTWKHVKT